MSAEAKDEASLAEISRTTIAHYEDHAEQFWMGTRDHDVSQNIDALLSEIEGVAPFRILDFGCGPGRDLRAFVERGHAPIGLDGAASFVRMEPRTLWGAYHDLERWRGFATDAGFDEIRRYCRPERVE